MESNPVVFDISSEDDEATPAWEELKGDDYNWFSEALEAVDKRFDDPDEVVVVGEVNPNKKSKSWNSSVRKVVDEDDDDCVILESDPDKALSDVNDPQDDSDDLLIVGQKGQIACRDFPHPRHDCAKFPFSSTSHEQHCELCHCFVCDTPAPCCYWGSGMSNTDHCHATNEEMWKTLRKNFRLQSNVPIPVAKGPLPSHSTAVPQLNQAPRHGLTRLTTQNQVSRPTPTRAPGNCIPQNHAPRPSIIRACSSPTRYGFPYNPTVGSRPVPKKSTVQPRSVSKQLLGVHNTGIRRDRGIMIRNLGSQFVSSSTMSKRLDTEVSSAMNCTTTYVPSENITSAHASQYQQCPASVTTSNDTNPDPIGWPKFCSDTNGTYTQQSSSQPSMGSVLTNSATPLPSAYSQPVPQSNVHQHAYHIQNQNQPATYNGFSDFNCNSVNNIGQINQQSSVDYLQLQTLGSRNEEEPFKEVNEGYKSIFKEFESLLFDNPSIPEVSLTAGLNPVPPDHISLDTGMIFFDIETTWDHLTRA